MSGREKTKQSCSQCGIHPRTSHDSRCVNCVENKKGAFVNFTEKWKKVEKINHKNFEIGDCVTVKLKKKDIPGEKAGSYIGYVGHFVPECRGWAVYILKKKKFFFVSEKRLTYEPALSPMSSSQLGVIVGSFSDKDKWVVEIHPKVKRFAESLQYGEVIAKFRTSKQYLMRLNDFNASLWKDAYEMVTKERLFPVPEEEEKVQKIEVADKVLVKDPNDVGFWRAKVVHWINRDKNEIGVRYANKNTGKTVFPVQPEWIYEKK